jgi:hypothetical protein
LKLGQARPNDPEQCPSSPMEFDDAAEDSADQSAPVSKKRRATADSEDICCLGCQRPRSSFSTNFNFEQHQAACVAKSSSDDKPNLKCQHCPHELPWYQGIKMAAHEAKCACTRGSGSKGIQATLHSFIRPLAAKPQAAAQPVPPTPAQQQTEQEVQAEQAVTNTPHATAEQPRVPLAQSEYHVMDLIQCGFSNRDIMAEGATPEMLRQGCAMAAEQERASCQRAGDAVSAAKAALQRLGVAVCTGTPATGFPQPFASNYAFGAHAETATAAKPTWRVSTDGMVQSLNCAGFYQPFYGASCRACSGIVHGGHCPAYTRILGPYACACGPSITACCFC